METGPLYMSHVRDTQQHEMYAKLKRTGKEADVCTWQMQVPHFIISLITDTVSITVQWRLDLTILLQSSTTCHYIWSVTKSNLMWLNGYTLWAQRCVAKVNLMWLNGYTLWAQRCVAKVNLMWPNGYTLWAQRCVAKVNLMWLNGYALWTQRCVAKVNLMWLNGYTLWTQRCVAKVNLMWLNGYATLGTETWCYSQCIVTPEVVKSNLYCTHVHRHTHALMHTHTHTHARARARTHTPHTVTPWTICPLQGQGDRLQSIHKPYVGCVE